METLKRILVEPKNALVKQYQKLFELENVELSFTKDAIEHISKLALDYKLGARGLRSICEAIMTDPMFEIPSKPEIKTFEVDLEFVKQKLSKSKLSKLKVA